MLVRLDKPTQRIPQAGFRSFPHRSNVAVCILGLLFLCSPVAVLGAVIPVIVDSVDAPAFWPFAHVGEEVLEQLPASTDTDAATAISVVPGRFGVIAPLKHGLPCEIGMTFEVHPACVPMSFYPTTTTTRGFTVLQVVSMRESLITTFASAPPYQLYASVSSWANYAEFAELLSGKVYFSHRANLGGLPQLVNSGVSHE